MNTDTLPQPINPALPIQTLTGQRVTIIDEVPSMKYSLIGVINYGGGSCRFMRWNKEGTPFNNQKEPGYNIENVPGYESVTVHLNIYEDDTGGYSTGYGYANKQLADKYAPVDNRLPVVGQVKTQLVFPAADSHPLYCHPNRIDPEYHADPDCHSGAQPKDLPNKACHPEQNAVKPKDLPEQEEACQRDPSTVVAGTPSAQDDKCLTHD